MESKLLADLNTEQKKAVQLTEGPLIIFAGAGTGKTRVLTRRIAYIIDKGLAYPEEILAITFTNKAANEMKNRVSSLIGEDVNRMWISTFHSMCTRILRRYAGWIGFDESFSIYDADDSKQLLKNILKDLKIDAKQLKYIQSDISRLKNLGITPDEYKERDYCDETVLKCYSDYEEFLFMSNAMDFDDLMLMTKDLLESYPDVRGEFMDKFRYIMVDEYQDTNHIQFELINLLCGEEENICVVGDDDQSIYKFRGADINNILDFEKTFAGCNSIILKENYRSTKNILKAAQNLIEHNRKRRDKSLCTKNPEGNKIESYKFNNPEEEAECVIRDIRNGMRDYYDIAILYRNNNLSRPFEEACIKYGVPYQIIGGTGFYQRKEIKDLIAYLKIIANPADEMAFRRIINVPKRGIGDTTVSKISEYAKTNKITFYDALKQIDDIKGIALKIKGQIKEFISSIDIWKKEIESSYAVKEKSKTSHPVTDYIKFIIDNGYMEEIEKSYTEESFEDRKSNIEEFKNKLIAAEKEEDFSLNEFLESIALVSEKDSITESKISMMTFHSAKGLEFGKVYMIGMNNGVFPGFRTLSPGHNDEMEEERRLAYVGITRAKEELTFTCTEKRMINGNMEDLSPSIFLEEAM